MATTRIIFEKLNRFSKLEVIRTAQVQKDGSVLLFAEESHPRRNTKLTYAAFSIKELEEIVRTAKIWDGQDQMKIVCENCGTYHHGKCRF